MSGVSSIPTPPSSAGRHRAVTFLALLLYLGLGLWLFPRYIYDISTDGTSYASIAAKYARGEWWDAINGYWGPLFCWLLAPLLALDIRAIPAMTGLSLGIGALLLLTLRRLAYHLALSPFNTTLALFALIPLLLHAAFSSFAPDFLMTLLLAWYLTRSLDTTCTLRPRAGLLTGLSGGLLFLCKSYGAPFFLAHFTLLSVARFFGHSETAARKNIFRHYIIAIVTFLLIWGGWAGLMSAKYQKPMLLGGSGKWVWASFNPERGGSAVYFAGFLPPKNNTATSSWEDPNDHTPLMGPDWTPFQSRAHLTHFLDTATGHALHAYRECLFFSPLFFLAILVALFRLRCDRTLFMQPDLWLLLTLFIYVGGYIPMNMEQRFIWIAAILLLLMGLRQTEPRNPQTDVTASRLGKIPAILAILFAATFLIYPGRELVSGQNEYRGRGLYLMAEKLKADYQVHGKMAADSEWDFSLFLAHHLGMSFDGIPKEADTAQTLQEALSRNGVDYFLVWGTAPLPERLTFLSYYQELTGGGLKIGENKPVRLYCLHPKTGE